MKKKIMIEMPLIEKDLFLPTNNLTENKATEKKVILGQSFMSTSWKKRKQAIIQTLSLGKILFVSLKYFLFKDATFSI